MTRVNLKDHISPCCPATTSTTKCPIHKDAQKKYKNELYRIRRENRLCTTCSKPLGSSDTVLICRRCQDRRKQRRTEVRNAIRTVTSWLPGAKRAPKVRPQWQIMAIQRKREASRKARELGICNVCIKTPASDNYITCFPCRERRRLSSAKDFAERKKKLERVARMLSEEDPEALNLLDGKAREDSEPAPSSDGYEPSLPHDFNIHPVMSIEYLCATPEGKDPSERSVPPPEPVKMEEDDSDVEEGDVCEVERILNHRPNRERTGYDYFIKWKAWGHEYNTWKTEWQLRHSDELIQEYWDRVRPEAEPSTAPAPEKKRGRGRPRKEVLLSSPQDQAPAVEEPLDPRRSSRLGGKPKLNYNLD